jgi:hypothetical protein
MIRRFLSLCLDAPGALILTTTRTDLLDLTREKRAGWGRVDVFNPATGWSTRTAMPSSRSASEELNQQFGDAGRLFVLEPISD